MTTNTICRTWKYLRAGIVKQKGRLHNRPNITIIAQCRISVNRNLMRSCDFSRLNRNYGIFLSHITSCNPELIIVSCRYRKGVSPMIM